MANISITLLCNRDCRYCFTKDIANKNELKEPNMSLATFRQTLDFLDRSGIKQVRLLGGEPTLHTRFSHLIDEVLSRGLNLLIFSNGLMGASTLDYLENIPLEKIKILLNTTFYKESALNEQKQMDSVFERLGPKVLLGVNIDSPSVELDFTVELIEKYGLSKTVRLGLAHPCIGGSNSFLHPKYYIEVGEKIISFAARAKKSGVDLEFDCGFVPCMFPAPSLKKLGKSLKDIGSRCNPILDILPDGRVISCYPLSEFHCEPLPEDKDASWLRKRFESKLAPYRSTGIFRECSVCSLHESGNCNGGCLAAAMNRLRHWKFSSSTLEEKYNNSLNRPKKVFVKNRKNLIQKEENSEIKPCKESWIIPYVDQPLQFWESVAEKHGDRVKEVYLPLPGKIKSSGRPLQLTENLEEFLCHSPFSISVLINTMPLHKPVEELSPIIIEDLGKLIEKYNVAGVTVSNLLLGKHIKKILPELSITASVLMDIAEPNQIQMLGKVYDSIVVSSRIVRDLSALKAIREAFSGKIRLIVNEACLPGCLLRVQHFYEMSSNFSQPLSLCTEVLKKHPWMRLTGAWVLPQHLHFYEGVYDELKLSGRVTLSNPETYLKVLKSYLFRLPLTPDEIGGGPASVLNPLHISENFFYHTLHCGHQCHKCSVCRDYYEAAMTEYNNEKEK
jgi:radical SAM protein with 4Fe4S-binding SPASM domain